MFNSVENTKGIFFGGAGAVLQSRQNLSSPPGIEPMSSAGKKPGVLMIRLPKGFLIAFLETLSFINFVKFCEYFIRGVRL